MLACCPSLCVAGRFGSPSLFFWAGDGGCAYDPYENAQNRSTIVGKIHRLQIDAIAAGNLSCSVPALTVEQLLAACPAYAGAVQTVAIGIRFVKLYLRGCTHKMYCADLTLSLSIQQSCRYHL